MRGDIRVTALAALLASTALPMVAAVAAEPPAQALPAAGLSAEGLSTYRGGTATPSLGEVMQTNLNNINASNDGNTIVNAGPGASMTTGGIGEATALGTHGITTFMQNTGDVVNMTYTMNLNLYLK